MQTLREAYIRRGRYYANLLVEINKQYLSADRSRKSLEFYDLDIDNIDDAEAWNRRSALLIQRLKSRAFSTPSAALTFDDCVNAAATA